MYRSGQHKKAVALTLYDILVTLSQGFGSDPAASDARGDTKTDVAGPAVA